MSTFTIRTNLPDFHRQILELRADLQGKSLRGAASAAANVLAKSVRDQIGAKGLVRTGVMQRSVYVSRTRRPTGPGVASIFDRLCPPPSRQLRRDSPLLWLAHRSYQAHPAQAGSAPTRT